MQGRGREFETHHLHQAAVKAAIWRLIAQRRYTVSASSASDEPSRGYLSLLDETVVAQVTTRSGQDAGLIAGDRYTLPAGVRNPAHFIKVV